MEITTFLRPIFAVIALGIAGVANAQIGYQVSLLNTATGEPRANERVSVNVKITDSKGTVICSEVKSETTNDFGVVSMSVGNSETFAEADWSNLPFFIEASVDGRLIGRSQLLSVPVAEHAKHTGTLTKEILCSKSWSCSYGEFVFEKSGSAKYVEKDDEYSGVYNYSYHIDGNTVVLIGNNDVDYDGWILQYIPSKKCIIATGASNYR